MRQERRVAHSLAGSGVSHHAPGCFCCAKAAWAFAHPARRIEKAKLCRPSAPLTQGGRGSIPTIKSITPKRNAQELGVCFVIHRMTSIPMVSMSSNAMQGRRRPSQRYDAISQYLTDVCCDCATQLFTRLASPIASERSLQPHVGGSSHGSCQRWRDVGTAVLVPVAGDQKVHGSRYFEHTGAAPECPRREWSLGARARLVVLSRP